MRYPKFQALNTAIDEYYDNAFSPEIVTAFQFVENSSLAAELIAKYKDIGSTLESSNSTESTKEGQRFQTNLLFIQKKFQEALSSLKLSNSFTLYIDGIDIRPANIPYDEYLDCVKGLANAAWSLNNDFFPSIRDSHGRMKVVLLLRPDIFNSLGLQNRNTKLKDNSILLSWLTDYGKHRDSQLFLLADRIFSSQQDAPLPPGAAWDHYFPFNATTVTSDQKSFTSFVTLLRYSYHRPRDILTILDILKELYVPDEFSNRIFTYEDLFANQFKHTYGEYLLGEIKDSLSFFYDEKEFELFLKFFEYLNGAKSFTYETYEGAFAEFSAFLSEQSTTTPDFMKTSDEFLQFLYDQNILNFIEDAGDEKFIRWCFRERTPTNISPKVKLGMTYEIHYGLANTLNTGKAIKKPSRKKKASIERKAKMPVGKIIKLDRARGFGFIRQEGLPIDIHFRIADCVTIDELAAGVTVNFRLEKSKVGGLSAKEVKIAG